MVLVPGDMRWYRGNIISYHIIGYADYQGFEADHCPLVAEFELRQIGDMGDGMSRLAGRLGGNGNHGQNFSR